MGTTTTPPPPSGLEYSFSGGGWLKLYLFGVAKYLKEQKLINDSRFIGCSAGALAAIGLGLDCDFDAIRDHVLDHIVERAHTNMGGLFRVRRYLTETLNTYGKLDQFERLNRAQNVVVSYSALFACRARRVSVFESKHDVLQVLLASCCASPIAGLPFRHRGEFVFDGGVTDFQPLLGPTTVTVSPFYCTNTDIRPSRYVPMWWAMCPPNRKNLEWLFDLGYDDAHAWATRQGFVQPTPSVSLKTQAAKYDGQWKTKFGRFTGYHGCLVESHMLDMFFMVFVVVLWKPLAFALVYMELAIRATMFAGTAIVFAIACQWMLTLSLSGLVASSLMAPPSLSFSHALGLVKGRSVLVLGLSLIAVLGRGGIHRAAEKAEKDWQNFCACLRNIGSLSLLLRTIPVVGSTVPIKRHAFLLQYSFVYRLTNHFV